MTQDTKQTPEEQAMHDAPQASDVHEAQQARQALEEPKANTAKATGCSPAISAVLAAGAFGIPYLLSRSSRRTSDHPGVFLW